MTYSISLWIAGIWTNFDLGLSAEACNAAIPTFAARFAFAFPGAEIAAACILTVSA